MERPEIHCTLVSDFNLGNLAGYLRNHPGLLDIQVHTEPYGQVVQTLLRMAADPEGRDRRRDAVVVWTQPERVIPSFRDVLDYRTIPVEQLMGEVDAFAETILESTPAARTWLVPSWTVPSYRRGLGLLDMMHGLGTKNLLARMNVRLSERLSEASNVYVLDAERWVSRSGAQAYSERFWYMAKIPFSADVLKTAVEDIHAAMAGVAGLARKLVIVDLDDTLWGGVVGDAGWQNLRLGGHDPIGESFAAFQQALKALTHRGILLGIVSKNEESVALEALERHPEMVLRLDDFAGWRINWEDKAKNVAELTAEINLGLQSVVFIDDNPVERDRVRSALPEVYVPDWPQDKMQYVPTLMELACFDVPALSEEDAARTRMYTAARKREKEAATYTTVDSWLESLETVVQVERLIPENLPRTVQLFNKTNQMNLATRRLTEAELTAWAEMPGHHLWTFRVRDRFGESGLTGIASLALDGSTAEIVDFILSCRVMGRRIEESIVSFVVGFARSSGADRVLARYLPTAKNKPCLAFWKRSGFTTAGDPDTFVLDARNPYDLPKHIELQSDYAVVAA